MKFLNSSIMVRDKMLDNLASWHGRTSVSETIDSTGGSGEHDYQHFIAWNNGGGKNKARLL